MNSARCVVIATWGSLGDLHPYLAIAVELERRGHRVRVATNEAHADKVRALGLEFAPLGPTVPEGIAARKIIEQAMHPWRGSQWLFENFLDPYARQSLQELRSATQGADFLLAHAIVLAAPVVAREKSLRWGCGVLSPLSLWSEFDPPAVAIPSGTATVRNATMARAFKLLARSATRGWFKNFSAMHAQVGLPSSDHPLFETMFSGQMTLALFSRELGAPQPDWPSNTIQCGAPLLQAVEESEQTHHTDDSAISADLGDPADWKAWVEEGEPVIVWTLGSTAVHVAHGFWRYAFHSARLLHEKLGLRSLFLAGDQRFWPMPIPPRAWGLACAYAPFEKAFEQAALIVHQGGVGTTQAAMRAAVPQLVVPWAQDQPDNAARIVARGLGLTLRRAQFNTLSAAGALEQLATNPKYLSLARTTARAMEPEAHARAAEAIENAMSGSTNGSTR